MAYVVTSNCVDCRYTDCASVCPVEAFHLGPRMMYIDPDTCIDCNACVPACPVEAIFPGDQVPDSQARFKDLNAEGAKKYPSSSTTEAPLGSKMSMAEIKAKFPTGIKEVSGDLV